MARGLIVAVRHPRALAGARVCIGRMDAGLAEPADAAAMRLLDTFEDPVDRIVSSPLRRALDVARAAARRTGAPLHADDRLTEQDHGEWEGRSWPSLPPADVAAWRADPVRVAPGGGESGAAMLRRVRHVWTRLASSEGTTLVLTHAGPIQCLLHIAGGLALAEALGRGIAFEEAVRFEAVRPGPAAW